VKLVWDESAWADYVWRQAQDRNILKRINTLITDIQRNGNEGIGKPEPCPIHACFTQNKSPSTPTSWI
jgi:toxin YoeB